MNTQTLGRLFIPLLVIAYCGYMIWEQTMGSYRAETRNYAYFMGGVAIVLAIVVIVRSLLNKDPADQDDEPVGQTAWANYRMMGLLLLGAVCVVLTIESLGYLVTFSVFLLFALWVLGVRTPTPLFLIPLGTMIVVHFVLVKALSLPLPAGFLRGLI